MPLEQFPYTNFHELNLSWVLEQVKKLTAEYVKMDKDFKDLKDYVMNYFNSLDLDQEIIDILNQMDLDGTLGSILLAAIADKSQLVCLGDYDSGLGNCNIMVQDGLAFVVDIGYTTTAKTLRDYIKNNNLTVKALAISHYHNDHIGTDTGDGLSAFLNDPDIVFANDFKVYLPHNLIDWSQVNNNASLQPLETLTQGIITTAGFPMAFPTENQQITISGFTVTFNNLAADKFSAYYAKGITIGGNIVENTGTNAQYNDFSMIVTIETNGKRIVIPGDIQQMAESENRDVLAQPDIYILEHHGGNYTADTYFLNNMNPQFAVLQAWGSSKKARNSKYWTRATTYQCLSKQSQVYHTNESGTVIFTISIDGITVEEENNINTTDFNAVNAPGMSLLKGSDLDAVYPSLDTVQQPGRYYNTSANTFIANLPPILQNQTHLAIDVNILEPGSRVLEQIVRTVQPPYVVAKRYLADADDNTTWSEWIYYGEGQTSLVRLTDASDEWLETVANTNTIFSFIQTSGTMCTISMVADIDIQSADTVLLDTGIPYISSNYVYPISMFHNLTTDETVLARIINNSGTYALAIHTVTTGRVAGSITFPIYTI